MYVCMYIQIYIHVVIICIFYVHNYIYVHICQTWIGIHSILTVDYIALYGCLCVFAYIFYTVYEGPRLCTCFLFRTALEEAGLWWDFISDSKECPSRHTSRLSHSSSSQLFNLIIAGGFGGVGSIPPNHKISKQPWQVQSQSAWYKHPHGTNWNFSAQVHKCTSALVSIRITCNPTFPVRRWRRLCPLSDLGPACASSIMSCFRVTLSLMFHPRSSILCQCGPNWKLRGRN